MSEVAFIGNRNDVWPFVALGADVFFADEHPSIPRLVNEVSQKQFQLIYVTEAVYEAAKERIEEFSEKATPAFAIIPSVEGSRGIAAQIIRASVRKAMGAELV